MGLEGKTEELKRQSDTLKRLKRRLEASKAQLSDGMRDLKAGQRELEAQKRAHEKAQTAQKAGIVLSCIPGLKLIGAAVVAGSGIAKGVISADIDGLKGVVKSRQQTVDMHETHMREAQGDKDSQRNEVQELHRILDQLRRERLATKDKILATDTENRRCTALGLEIKAAEVKVIEMYNAANNTSTRAEKAFDMEQMAIPLNELLVSLENNIDVLDEGAKAEILLTRFKFQKFKRAPEAKGGDAVEAKGGDAVEAKGGDAVDEF